MSGAIPFVSSKGLSVLGEAVLFRVFASVNVACAPAAYERAYYLRSILLRGFLSSPAQEMGVWEWILTMPSRRRKQLIRVYKKRQAIGEDSTKYDIIKAFVKVEMLPYFKQDDEGSYSVDGLKYVPRLIQAPHDETHLDAGPWLKPLTQRLKDEWHCNNWLFYASVSPEKLDTWLRRNAHARSWFWSDYSAFDASYSTWTWGLIERFYAILYPDAPPSFWKAISAWRQPHGKVRLPKEDAVLEYHAPVINASGRDDTALANALMNGITLALAFSAALSGKLVQDLTEDDVLRASQRVNIAVVGDDSLVACDFDVGTLTREINSAIEQFGFSAKVNHSDELCDVTFLGMMPYPVAGQYYWGPTVGRRGYKAFWQCDPTGNLPAWTMGVAKQLALYQCVPILSDMANRVVELLNGGKCTTIAPDENRVWASRSTATPRYDRSTEDWLCRRYIKAGLTPLQIAADRKTLQSISRLPAITRLHTMDAGLSWDEL